jgi:cytoskeleton protein RodZ
VFEIGNSLREARLRQSLDLARAETETKIRAKYLEALESERFEVLPGETYVKGFLRTYAEYLGLDGQLYVDEFNSRFASGEEQLVSSAPAHRPRSRAAESNFVVVALAGIVAVTILVVVAFAFGDDAANEPAVPPVTGAQSTNSDKSSSGPAAKKAKAKPPRVARLVLTAARGECWVEVRRGGPTGELVFSGTIFEGDSERFAARRLWVNFGAAQNLDAKLNGKAVDRLPDGQAVVVVTSRGIRTQPRA